MNKFFLYLFLITLSFPFNINNASDDDWNTLSNVISNEKIQYIITNYNEFQNTFKFKIIINNKFH